MNLAVLASSGTTDPGDAGDASVHPTPKYDGTDVWAIDPSSYSPKTELPLRVAPGWVRDGVLVIQNLNMVFSQTLRLEHASFTANFVTGPNGVELADGVVGGRVPTSAILKLAGRIIVGGKPICSNTPMFTTVRSTICDSAEIRQDDTEDFTGTPCNALSLALSLTAPPALIGGIRDVAPALDSGCGGIPDCMH